MERLTSVGASRRGWVIHGAVLLLIIAAPFLVPNRFELFNAELLTLFMVGAISLNLLLITGLISIGHSALYLIGGYFVAILTVTYGWPFSLALLLGVLASTLIGLLSGIPALRLGLFTFAMVTLGYSIVAEKLAIEWRGITGGANGLAGVGFPGAFDLESYYWVLVATLILAYALMHNMIRSPFGRAGRALGSQPIAAQAVGIEPSRVQLLAFSVSSGLAGLAGGLYVPLLGFIAPDAFTVHFAILLLLMPILGGSSTIAGPIVGTFVLFRLPIEVERLTDQPGEWSLLVFGVVLILTVHFIPRGIMGGWWDLKGWWRRRLGNGAAERSEVEWSARGEASVASVLEPVNQDGGMLLDARGVRKNLGGVQALDGLDLRLEAGSTHALIGPNGSGKTTFLNTLSGFMDLDEGSERAFGEDLGGMSPATRARAGLARTFQTPLVFGEMSCLENVFVALDMRRERSLLAYALRLPSARREEREQYAEAERLLDAVGLMERKDEPAGDLPPGQTRLLEIARVLALRPRAVLMDEPAAGLNDEEITELEGVVGALANSGVGVIIVEHHAEMVMRLSDVVTVIDFGEVIAHGPPEQVRNDPKVLEAYLGDEGEDERAALDSGGTSDEETVP